MALHWQLPKPLTISSPHAHDLIWFTMLAQMGTVTAANLPEFTRRLRLWQTHLDDFGIPYEVLPQFVGMSTNVVNRTKADWNRYFVSKLEARLQK